MTGRGRAVRWGAMPLCVGVLAASCASEPQSADGRLCAEVERVVGELNAQEVPIDEAEDVFILASHLVVAATGDQDGKPSPELAEVVHAAGMQGANSQADPFLDGLVTSYEACEDAGIAMDRGPLETLAEQ